MKPKATEVKKLECMSTHLDGAHCGLADWYPEIEKGINEALAKGPCHAWTTGWYSSKKEIASCCITCHGDGTIDVEVSVSDDFDTVGHGVQSIDFTVDNQAIEDAIYQAWEFAEKDRKANRVWAGYSIHSVEGNWIETYIKSIGDGFMHDEPPGDYYHCWGFQGDSIDQIPASVKAKIEEWIEEAGEGEFAVVYDTGALVDYFIEMDGVASPAGNTTCLPKDFGCKTWSAAYIKQEAEGHDLIEGIRIVTKPRQWTVRPWEVSDDEE